MRTKLIWFCRLIVIPLVGVLLVTESLAASSTPSLPELTVFGPETFVRSTGAPAQSVRSFMVEKSLDNEFVLTVENGRDARSRVSSAKVVLNGSTIFGPESFNQTVERLAARIRLRTQNTLHVELASAPGTELSIRIMIDVSGTVARLETDLATTLQSGPGATPTVGDIGVQVDVSAALIDEFRQFTGDGAILQLGSLRLTALMQPNGGAKAAARSLLAELEARGVRIEDLSAALEQHDFHAQAADAGGAPLPFAADAMLVLPSGLKITGYDSDGQCLIALGQLLCLDVFVVVTDSDTHSIHRDDDIAALIAGQFVERGELTQAARGVIHELLHAMAFRTDCMSGGDEEALVATLEGIINLVVAQSPLTRRVIESALGEFPGGRECFERLGLGSDAPPAPAAFAYIANNGSSTVSIIDTATDSVTGTVPVGRWPVGVAARPEGTRAYVVAESSSALWIIDATTKTVVETVPLGFFGSFGVAFDARTNRVYIANINDRVLIVDAGTNRVVGSVALVRHQPVGIGVNPTSMRVYVANDLSSTIAVIDTITNSVTAIIPVGGRPRDVAVHPSGARAYVTNRASNNVSVVDTSINEVVATIPVGASPMGVAVDPRGRRVYAANGVSNSVSVIDAACNIVVATVPVGNEPHGLAVHPTGPRVYVANLRSNSVSAIDTVSNAVVATVAVQSGPVAIGRFIRPPSPSEAPVAANAGCDQVVNEGATVTLDGSLSVGQNSGFSWAQVAGAAVEMRDPGSARPSFIAPLLPSGVSSQTLTFRLTVGGEDQSHSDFVNIFVSAG